MPATRQQPTQEESRRVAEAARETEWAGQGFLRDLFLGDFRLHLLHPFPVPEGGPRPEFVSFYTRLRAFLTEKVDPVAIDAWGEYPPEVIRGLAELGAFGMKIPRAFGGLELRQDEYCQVMEMLGAYDANVTALLSAHQSIGVPTPIMAFGTDEQKSRFLPRCAKGAISAFALTEPGVGSDPAHLATTCVRSEDGEGYILNGEKLWCTNGTLAELLVVMARDPQTNRISAFVVETSDPGVTVTHRCRFMGLRAISNAVIQLDNVRVPAADRIGDEGRGLKIALVTLNTGRLALPASAAGMARACLQICRQWAGTRAQWGVPIGKHEAIAHRLTEMAATTFAMESVSALASTLATKRGYDIRLEAAAAKEWNATHGWLLIDKAMQIRGGRGYETERSLASRGEVPSGIERFMRDSRINRIFEGSSEIMHLFMAREAVDKHLQVAGAMVNPKAGLGEKLAALPRMAAFYVPWYLSRWWGLGTFSRYGQFGALAGHLRFVERSSRRLAREIFHGMVVYQAKLERKQAFLFRLIDVANELFVMTAVVSRADRMRRDGDASAAQAAELADAFCRDARRRVAESFHGVWHNDDDWKTRTAKRVLDGTHAWAERDPVGDGTVESLVSASGRGAADLPEEGGVAAGGEMPAHSR